MMQLKCLATGKDFDEVSMYPESDIYSVMGERRGSPKRVSDWIQPPADNVEFEEHLETVFEDSISEYSTESTPTRPDLPDDLPNTNLGSFRSASRVDYQFNSLNVTEENVESLLVLSQGPDEKLSMSSSAAQDLDIKLRSCGELIVTTQYALDQIEFMWTGEKRKHDSNFSEAPDVELYVILEYRCFISTSWHITRELTCFAVTKSAFDILQKCAASKKGYRARELPNVSGAYPSTSLNEAIECLLSDSAKQILQASISSTLISIRPSPAEKDEETEELPSLVLDFRGIDKSLIGQTVEEYSKCARKQASKRLQLINQAQFMSSGGKGRRGYETFRRKKTAEFEAWSSKYRRKTTNRSFARKSSRSVCIRKLSEHDYSCSRCSKSRPTAFAAHWAPSLTPSSTNNTMLVQAIIIDTTGKANQERNHLCLFFLGTGPEIKEGGSIAEVVEEHLNGGKVHHTILHGPPLSEAGLDRAVLWNLPWPYRPCTKREERDLGAWVQELKEGHEPEVIVNKKWMGLWDHSQILLHYLREGLTYERATIAVKSFRDRQRERQWENRTEGQSVSEIERVNAKSFWDHLDRGGSDDAAFHDSFSD